VKLADHPDHGPIDTACRNGAHRGCSGYAGAYGTHICGCCCHDERFGASLTVFERDTIARLTGEPA